MFGREKYSKEAFEEAQDAEQNPEAVAKKKKEQLLDGAFWTRHNAVKASERASGRGMAAGMGAHSDMSTAFKIAKADEKNAEKITPESVRKEARRKLDALMKAGHSEAIKVNEKYDELSDRAANLHAEALQAQEELENFERDKLGMTFEETSDEEASE